MHASFILQNLCFLLCAFQFFSQESPQQRNDQNNAAMDLINSVTGVDDEGRSRQRILTFAARRYHNYHVLLAHQLRWYFLIIPTVHC